MAEQETVKMEPVRVMIRVNIPQVDPQDVAQLQQRIKALVKGYQGVDVEVTMLPVLQMR